MPSFKLPSILSKPSTSQTPFLSSKLYESKNRFALIGPVGCGKSTIAALIALTTQTLSCAQKGFYCRILERNSNIYGDVSNIRSGRFPEKTLAHDAWATEAGLLLAKKTMFGFKQIQLPLIDLAGEDIAMMIRQYKQATGQLGSTVSMLIDNLLNYVKESEGIIVVADASKIVFRYGEQLQREGKNLHPDADVNLVRILNETFDWKQSKRKPLKAIFIVVTKWDAVKYGAPQLGINIMDPNENDLAVFMDTFFPSVSQAIKSYQLTNPSVVIRYFPTYLEVERNDDRSVKQWPEGGDKIKPKESNEITELRKPSYSEQPYAELIECLLGFAT